MANYKYEVITDNEVSVDFDTIEEAHRYRDELDKTNQYDIITVKRYWYMDELITEENNNE